MNRRLLRALERGGIVAQIDANRWGVWRSKDRRSRMIGSVSDAEIDLLRLREILRPLGDDTPMMLVWSGKPAGGHRSNANAKTLNAPDPDARGPMIDLIITRCHDPVLRKLIRETTQLYRADTECACDAGRIAGMNWDGLALGGRIGGGQGGGRDTGSAMAAKAAARLRMIQNRLGSDEVRFLDDLMVREESRAKLARLYGVRPSLIEQRALASVRSLHELYKTCTKVSV